MSIPQRCLLSLLTALLWPAATEAGSFPAVPYSDGTIKPSHVTQQVLDRQLFQFYSAWKAVYVAWGCGEGRAFINVGADGAPVWGGTARQTITVSEAHGYGMLATVMLADADPEAKTLFDGMLRYFLDHPAQSGPGLMAWNQVEGCGNAGEEAGGDNSATDGDLDIGYALLLADHKWGSGGTFDYRALAGQVLNAVLAHETSAGGDFVQLGDWAGSADDGTYRSTTRSSDFMPSHFNAFARAAGDARWTRLRDSSYAIMAAIRANDSPSTGLVPDFIVGLPDGPAPAPSGFLEGEHDGAYSWNAARYPWRVALDYLLYGEERARDALRPLNVWARQVTGGDPQTFADTYFLDGRRPPDGDENQMAFVSMLAVSAMIEPGQQEWLDALWDDVVAAGIEDEDYFGNTLKLMAMIAVTGHWAKP